MREKLAMAAMVGSVAATVARERLGPPIRVQSSAQVPASADSLTVEWLSDVLCVNTPDVRVTDFEVTGGSDGTSSRRAISIVYSADAKGELPTRLFSKAATGLFSRLLLGLTDIAEGESVFYNQIRPGLELRSPRAFHAGFDRRSRRSFVLLEDLSHAGWTFPDPQKNSVTWADADDMVEQLARYHAAFWESPRLGMDLAALKPAARWQEDLDRRVGFEARTMRGFDRAVDVLPGAVIDERATFYTAFRRSLALHAAAAPTVLHQDLHLGNWLRDPDGRMGLYDWQCVAVGHWALDYAYALSGSLAPADRRNWEEDLLRQYLGHLASMGVASPPTFDTAWLAYRQQPMHALAFGLFTLGGSRFEPELQPRDYTLAAIERIATFLADHDSLGALAGP